MCASTKRQICSICYEPCEPAFTYWPDGSGPKARRFHACAEHAGQLKREAELRATVTAARALLDGGPR